MRKLSRWDTPKPKTVIREIHQKESSGSCPIRHCMLKKPSLNNTTERGYTLIETVVAMALFLSVLIPLVTTVGNVIFDRKTALFQKALAVAQTEMSLVAASKNYFESTRNTEDGLVVARSIQKRYPLIEVKVTVKATSGQLKELVVLKRIILEYERSE